MWRQFDQLEKSFTEQAVSTDKVRKTVGTCKRDQVTNSRSCGEQDSLVVKRLEAKHIEVVPELLHHLQHRIGIQVEEGRDPERLKVVGRRGGSRVEDILAEVDERRLAVGDA